MRALSTERIALRKLLLKTVLRWIERCRSRQRERCDYLGRGRRGGRPVSGRGRMRKCGVSGGGTVRTKSPQQGQRPSCPIGPAVSARSQWPRISQCGLMHCTVKPGKYCICVPSAGASIRGCTEATCSKSSPGRPERNDGGHCGAERDRCQGKRATRYCGVIALWKSAFCSALARTGLAR